MFLQQPSKRRTSGLHTSECSLSYNVLSSWIKSQISNAFFCLIVSYHWSQIQSLSHYITYLFLDTVIYKGVNNRAYNVPTQMPSPILFFHQYFQIHHQLPIFLLEQSLFLILIIVSFVYSNVNSSGLQYRHVPSTPQMSLGHFLYFTFKSLPLTFTLHFFTMLTFSFLPRASLPFIPSFSCYSKYQREMRTYSIFFSHLDFI